MYLKIIIFYITFNFLFANPEIHKHVKINLYFTNQLLELGIPLDHYQKNKDNSLDIILSTSEIGILMNMELNLKLYKMILRIII